MQLYSSPPPVDRQDHQFVCSLHGERKTNLCERCMESLARGVRPGDGSVITKLTKRNSLVVISLWTWKFLQWLFEVFAAVFTCFFMMWFTLPESSPTEKRRRDLEWLRRKAADEEWLHRRDADYQRKLEEDDYWRRRQDPSHRQVPSQANTPYSTSGIDRIKRELSEMQPNGAMDAQLAHDGNRYLENAQHHRSEASSAYRRRTTGEE